VRPSPEIAHNPGVAATGKRPAHRPSRKGLVVEAAMRLCASGAPASVTVADIAEAAGMTSAAVYYHYPSKDDILLEGLRAFGQGLVAQARGRQQQVADGRDVGSLPIALLSWLDGHRAEAAVYFVYSPGANLRVESMRRAHRTELVKVFARAARSASGDLGAAEAGVVAAGLVSLFETAAASWITEDEVYRQLGRDRFLAYTGRLARRIAGQ
jgi:AcrR family transcriptional regulator